MSVPELEHLGVASQGRTREEALKNIQEVLQLTLEDLREEGKAVPKGAALVSEEPLVTAWA